MSARNPDLSTIGFAVDMASLLASTRSVFDVLAVSESAAEAFVQFFTDGVHPSGTCAFDEFFSQFGDLFGAETVSCPTDGAIEIVFKPLDRYLNLVTAVAGSVDVSCNFDLHGWPILPFYAPATVESAALPASDSSSETSA